MSAASTETSAPLPTAGSRVFFQPPAGVGCVGSGPITAADDPVQKKQGKVTVKYDRKELRKRLVLEEWIIEQLSELYDCEVSGAAVLWRAPVTSKADVHLEGRRQGECLGFGGLDWWHPCFSIICPTAAQP